jgi:hypothetical protein
VKEISIPTTARSILKFDPYENVWLSIIYIKRHSADPFSKESQSPSNAGFNDFADAHGRRRDVWTNNQEDHHTYRWQADPRQLEFGGTSIGRAPRPAS